MDLLQYEFMQRALVAGLLVALLCPLVGMFVVIRRQSLLGDGLGHIAFAGVTGAALVGTHPVLGAAVCTIGAAFGIEWLRRRHRQYVDMGLALFFYGGLALAVVCSSLAKIPYTGMMSFLFGSILTVTWPDIAGIAAISVAVLALLYRYRPALLLSGLDPDLAKVNGLADARLNLIFTALVACVVVVGMSIVGILLISALMIIPVAAAHLWHRGFQGTTLLALIYSFLMVGAGLTLSYMADLAPGGTIVLTGLGLYALTGLLRRFGTAA